MSSFLETLRQQTAAAKAAPAAGLEGLSATPFMTAEMEDLTVPGVDPAATVAPDADVVVVVTPEDEAVDPDADIAEGDALETLLACQASAETYGWSPALLDFMGRQGLLAGTTLESATSFENYSMEADGAAVGGEVSKSITGRVKEFAGRMIGKVGSLWDRVSAKLTGAENAIDNAGPVSDQPRKAFPYATVAAVVAGVLAASGAIYLMVKHVDFKALQAPGAIDKAAKAIDDSLVAVKNKLPKIGDRSFVTEDGFAVVRRKFSIHREAGSILPKMVKTTVSAPSTSKAIAVIPEKAGWTASSLQTLRSNFKAAHKAVSGAVSGLYRAAKNPGAIVDGAMANPQAAAHSAGKFAVLGFVGAVVAAVSWLLYHVVLKGAALVSAAVRAVTDGKKED